MMSFAYQLTITENRTLHYAASEFSETSQTEIKSPYRALAIQDGRRFLYLLQRRHKFFPFTKIKTFQFLSCSIFK